MSGKSYASCYSSESKVEFGLSPHIFKPERCQVEDENLINNLEFKHPN